MSKTILQEIATFNAQEQSTGSLKMEIAAYQDVVHDYYIASKEIIADNLSTYKIVAETIKNDLKNGTDEIIIKLDTNKIKTDVLEEFVIKEFSQNYKSLGTIRRDYKRKDVQLGDKINQLVLEKLEHFAGPTKSIQLDSNNNFTGYSAANLESTRDWIYIISRAIKYKGQNLLSLNSALTSITIGDSAYNKVILPGTLDLAGNLSISNGKISIISPLTETESITTNASIHSTAGAILATTGLSTTNGNISTGIGNITTTDGNISTSKGNLSTTEGDIISLKGSLKVTTGMLTTTGDIVTQAGSLRVTTGMSTTNGNITTGIGSLLITRGDIKTSEGIISTDRGAISTGDGNISTTRGNITTGQGDIKTSSGNINTSYGSISTSRGDISTLDGKLMVGSNGSQLLLNNGDLTISGRFTAGGTLNGSGLNISGGITCTTLTASGAVTASNFITTGTSSTGALTTTSLTTGSINASGNVTIQGTLTVNGYTTFNSDVNAGTHTITAALFNGMATSAKYADVAEKYLCNEILLPGTVVSLSTNDNYEIELYNENLPLAGVVSTAPGVRLNDGADTEDPHWLLVALAGRIPVLVSNNVTKGMFLLPDRKNPGQAFGIYKNEVQSNDMLNLIGIAISNSNNGIVEAKVK